MRVSLATLALSGLLAVPASAGEQIIEFRYVIHPLEVKTFEAPKIEGQTMVMGKVFGVVAFKDGRVGTEDFIYQAEASERRLADLRLQHLQVRGRLLDHGELRRRDQGQPAARGLCDPVGHRRHANATGTGTFESLLSKLEGATILNTILNVKTP